MLVFSTTYLGNVSSNSYAWSFLYSRVGVFLRLTRNGEHVKKLFKIYLVFSNLGHSRHIPDAPSTGTVPALQHGLDCHCYCFDCWGYQYTLPTTFNTQDATMGAESVYSKTTPYPYDESANAGHKRFHGFEAQQVPQTVRSSFKNSHRLVVQMKHLK